MLIRIYNPNPVSTGFVIRLSGFLFPAEPEPDLHFESFEVLDFYSGYKLIFWKHGP